MKDPNEVVKVQQPVEVTVVEVDVARKRIALSMKRETVPQAPAEKASVPKEKRDKRKAPAGKAQTPKKGPPAARKSPERPAKPESLEEKLAQLRSKFGRE